MAPSWFSNRMSLDTTNFLPYFCNGIATTGDGHVIGLFVNGGIWFGQSAIFRREQVVSGVAEINQVGQSEQLYPNPASSSITITSFDAGSTVHLLDILGRELMYEVVPASGSLTLDVSSLPAGLYYVSDGNTRAKFVKE